MHIGERHKQTILRYTRDLAKALGVIGLVNIQFIVYNDEIYVIEVNPRSSRTIPYISKVTGVPIIDLATRVMLGEKLRSMGCGTGIYREADYYAVKMPVFSFEKLTDVDTGLGPEMKSTGECLGLAESSSPSGMRTRGRSWTSPGALRIWTSRSWPPPAPVTPCAPQAYPPARWPGYPRPIPTSWT